MRTIIGWLSATVLGSVAWWLGAKIHFGVGILASAVAGGFGLYYGYRWFDENLD